MSDILARIDALLANTPPSEVEEFEVCRCLRDAKAEIERLRQHRCRWGNDPSGPYYSDEYLSAIDDAPAKKVRGLWFPPATQPPPPAPPAPPSVRY